MDVYRELMAVTKEGTGVEMTRKQAKTVFLGLLYGMGTNKLAGQLGVEPASAQTIKNALLDAVPSIRDITNDVKGILSSGGFVRTWGGRVYHSEKPKFIDGNHRTFDYKGLNLLIQGSAADETKEALIRYDSVRSDSRLLLQVHDELVICSPKESAAREMKKLRECMEGLGLEVPLLSEGEAGYRWGQMEAFKDE
jgi:DNA polymerase-1